MTDNFANGYALIIGVDENENAGWALPAVKNDISELARVLTHPERCGYPDENVHSLSGKEATRENIHGQLRWLREAISADKSGNATAIVYYSGHGYRDDRQQFYLVPYDADKATFRATALRAEDFSDAIDALLPRRLLVVLDCCHAGGIGAKDVFGYVNAAMPPDVFMPDGPLAGPAPGAKGLEQLTQGTGRAVLSSSSGAEQSYVRKDGRMSIFTYHLIEALTGHAQSGEGATEVLVTDAISHITRCVPRSVRAEYSASQIPSVKLDGTSFPIALLLGGKGLATGAGAPDPLNEFPPGGMPEKREQSVTVAGNVGGDVIATKIVHGDEIRGDRIGRDKVTSGRPRTRRRSRVGRR